MKHVLSLPVCDAALQSMYSSGARLVHQSTVTCYLFAWLLCSVQERHQGEEPEEGRSQKEES